MKKEERAEQYPLGCIPQEKSLPNSTLLEKEPCYRGLVLGKRYEMLIKERIRKRWGGGENLIKKGGALK